VVFRLHPSGVRQLIAAIGPFILAKQGSLLPVILQSSPAAGI
jgi:hypothetical protein